MDGSKRLVGPLLTKGRQYVAVIVDHSNARVLEVLESREKHVVCAYVAQAKAAGVLSAVVEVTTDMWAGYVAAAREVFAAFAGRVGELHPSMGGFALLLSLALELESGHSRLLPWEPGEREWIAARLREFADDPARVAGEHGRLTGNCCFCHHTLEDARSTAVGYGPVCASHYGLPWGERPAAAAPAPAVASMVTSSSEDRARMFGARLRRRRRARVQPTAEQIAEENVAAFLHSHSPWYEKRRPSNS